MDALDSLPDGMMPLPRDSPLSNIYYRIVEAQIHDLVELNRSMERLLDDEVKRLNNYLEEITKNFDADRRAETYEHFADTHYKYSDMFPTMIRSSLLVSCYGFLETNLLRLCDWLQSERSLEVNAKGQYGRGIFQAKTYFLKVLKLPFPVQAPCWQEVVETNRIRNAIAHADGFVHPANTKLDADIKANSHYLSKDNANHLVIAGGYISHFLQTVQQLFHELEAITTNTGVH